MTFDTTLIPKLTPIILFHRKGTHQRSHKTRCRWWQREGKGAEGSENWRILQAKDLWRPSVVHSVFTVHGHQVLRTFRIGWPYHLHNLPCTYWECGDKALGVNTEDYFRTKVLTLYHFSRVTPSWVHSKKLKAHLRQRQTTRQRLRRQPNHHKAPHLLRSTRWVSRWTTTCTTFCWEFCWWWYWRWAYCFGTNCETDLEPSAIRGRRGQLKRPETRSTTMTSTRSRRAALQERRLVALVTSVECSSY